jgi:biotin carboxyl carrier protein
VVNIQVARGDSVNVGDGLLVIEAMKMENEIRADAQGTISDIRVQAQDTVDKDTVLMIIE